MSNPGPIVIHGAGSIGCYIGGWLAAAGAPVIYLGRSGIREEIAAHGMLLTGQEGRQCGFQPREVDYRTDPQVLSEARLILVAVKSLGTQAAAEEIRRHARQDALVVSLQNGLRNATALRAALRDKRVLAGMVPFNVVHRGPGHWHCGTSGNLQIEASPLLADYLPWFAQAGLPVTESADIAATQWGKLLLNLNNPINALSGLPLREQLAQAAYRRCLAFCVEEALHCLNGAGIRPRAVGPVPPEEMVRLLRLPDDEYQLVVGARQKIDAAARSSMWEDLEHGRPTEVDYLNGEVVALAKALGQSAPCNAMALALVHAAEHGGRRDWGGGELLQQLVSGMTDS
ncbi:2-dehydropantoate 2-reductase [Cupriavidus sp. TMH.W2]|uniref:2-dehydropantoate 2-reductase n=1 Tax=Cupriavidus sp. TMH.W2 TaxID=3434465 RepID=UPI003D7861DE